MNSDENYRERNYYFDWLFKIKNYCEELINMEQEMDIIEFNNYLQLIIARQLNAEGRNREANDVKLLNPNNPFLQFYSANSQE